MRDWNITQLNFTNDELQSLCSSYAKVLIAISRIEGKLHPKEIDFLVSMITRTNLEGNNEVLEVVNHTKDSRKLEIKGYMINNDYIRLFELENIIFYELEKSMYNFLSYLTNEKYLEKEPEWHIEEAKTALEVMKNVLLSKEEMIGIDFIESIFNGLYSYSKKLASLTGKGMFGKKTTEEEDALLLLIRNILKVEGKISQKDVLINRQGNILFD